VTSPSLPTIKKLFAKSGDRCAFPECAVHVVEGNTIIADICHIRAASALGPRYDPTQSDAERHAFDNLILLCANHHRIIDDDPEKYRVAALIQMKRAHEATATTLAADTVDRAVALLVQKETVNEAANTVPAVAGPPAPATIEAAQKQALMARACAFHRDRLGLIVANHGAVADLGDGRLVFHVIPVVSLDIQQSPGFAELSQNPRWFPPVAGAPRDSNISFDGLLVGSNGEGLRQPQRAYTHITRAGIVEVVASSLARGYDGNLIMLPQVQAMLIKYVAIYTNALNKVGIAPPLVVCASLSGVNNMRLLHDFIANAIAEDIPGPRLNRSEYTFVETWLDAAPRSIPDAARRLKLTLDHMANAAGLMTSPYFDENGDYTLMP